MYCTAGGLMVGERYLNRHAPLIQMIAGLIFTLVTLTGFAYTNFSTKEEVRERIAQIESHNERTLLLIEKRLERIEDKLDKMKQ